MNGGTQRQLTRAYQFNHHTFVWRCSQCSRMFFLGVEEADSDNIPRHILLEFTSHVCDTPRTLTNSALEREDFDDLVSRLDKDPSIKNRRVEHE